MSILGPDISSYEQGLNVAALSDPFVMMKCTEGTYYADPDYAGWLAQAKASKKLAVAYHFVKTESSAQAQAVWLAAHIGDMSVPVMLDVETEGSSAPHLPLVLDVIDAMHGRGLNVRLVYLPRWFWQQIGSPDLTSLTQRHVGVVASAYPGRRGLNPPVSYQGSGGDAGAGWAPYGGVTPVLWQFTDAAVEQQTMDFNAYRGTINQLAALLGGGPGSGVDMGSYTMSSGWQNDYPDVAAQLQQHIPVGEVIDDGTAAAYAMIRSFVAAERAGALEASVGALNTKLDQLLAVKAPVVDVAAIAAQVVAAISGHLSGGVDAQAVAVAVQEQLAQALGAHANG